MLQDGHVNVHGADVNFSFVGKKGVPYDVTVHDARLARLVRKCKEIPGQHLFQYYSADGQRHALESGDVNDYLHRHTGLALSAKAGDDSVRALTALRRATTGPPNWPSRPQHWQPRPAQRARHRRYSSATWTPQCAATCTTSI